MTKGNHLKGQTSPYLLQHLHNPVDWYPWGEEALEKARREDKPLLVSIGYSACHWCHVMEKESFEDDEVAAIMNRHFVCIKVDREERPDIDHLYMNAVQMVSGHGGWPLNCFALPDGRPVWGGTYFPKEQWKNILQRVNELYGQHREDLLQQADQLTRGLGQGSFVKAGEAEAVFSREEATGMLDNLMEYMDTTEGGTKGAPKFPLPNNHLFLLHGHALNGNKEALQQVTLSLDKMAMGGIYDQVGGGFARYATDIHWKVPHFEKMLYDNGQLVSLYAQAWKRTKDPLYREVVYDTIDFVRRELMSAGGLFYAALDADSEGEEGKFYVWTARELDQLLGEDAPLVKRYFQVNGKGFWEKGKNILMREEAPGELAGELGMDTAVLQRVVNKARAILLDARGQRIRPGLDDKVLVSWNALMIEGLSDAFAAFGEESFRDQACTAADQILDHAMQKDGRLYRALKGKEGYIDAFLEDYALLSMSLIRLYAVTGREKYLLAARTLTAYVMEHFSAEGTQLFAFSSSAAEQLAAPHYEWHDNVIPAANSVMARLLFYLAHYFEDPHWGKRSSGMLGDMKERLQKYSGSFTNWGMLLLHHVYPFYTVVITGPGARERAGELNARHLPNALLAYSDGGEGHTELPLFAGRFKEGKTMIHVCTMGHCKAPVETVEEALEQMGYREW